MKPLSRLLILMALALPAGMPIAPTHAVAPDPPPFRVIVNVKSPIEAVGKRFLAEAFLKKTTKWGHGEAIKPVDLRPDDAARRRFSDGVLERDVEAVKRYWQTIIFSGRGLPPPELDSDAAVVAYVASHPGAIGYISGKARVQGVGAVRVVPVR